MNWRYSGPDGSGCVNATCISPNDESWYYGEWEGSQPNGLGAYYNKDNEYIKGGYWKNGELNIPMTYEEYNSKMNQLQEDRKPKSHIRWN